MYSLAYGSFLNFGIVEASNRTDKTGLNLANSNVSTNNDIITAQILATSLEMRLSDSAAILEATSSLPEVRSAPNADLSNSTLETLHGVPQDSDMQKRRIAQTILSKFDDFAVVTYIMPNGDMYF